MITLRFPTPDDAPALAAAVAESWAAIAPWMDWAHAGYGAADALDWITDTTEARAAGSAFEFVVTDEDAVLGVCGLNQIHEESRRANLGYWTRTSATGRGVAPRAALQLARWGFTHTSLHRLEIVVAAGNAPSLRVAEKAGARREAVLRDRLWTRGEPQDAVMFSLLRTDPLPDEPWTTPRSATT